MKPLHLAHELVSAVVTPLCIAIDATCGNGHDTVFLAGLAGHVYAFDVQQQAIESTRNRLVQANLQHRVTLINDGHQNIAKYVRQPIRAAMFNLGFLPGSDKSVITTPDTTVEALDACLDLLEGGGLITVMVYPRHDGGSVERDAVLAWSRGHDAVIHGDASGLSPFLVVIPSRKPFK